MAEHEDLEQAAQEALVESGEQLPDEPVSEDQVSESDRLDDRVPDGDGE